MYSTMKHTAIRQLEMARICTPSDGCMLDQIKRRVGRFSSAHLHAELLRAMTGVRINIAILRFLESHAVRKQQC